MNRDAGCLIGPAEPDAASNPPGHLAAFRYRTEWVIAPTSTPSVTATRGRKEGPGKPLPILSHKQLMGLAAIAVEAAHDHDSDRVETNALRLFDAVTEHVMSERLAFAQLSPGNARLLRHRQQHIVDLVLTLAASAAHKADLCHCEHIAGDVIAELAVQADDERRHLLAVAERTPTDADETPHPQPR